jgi:outer membrane translocation and assembly module TamA
VRNQILFPGYGESTLSTGSITALQLGYRYNLFNNFYLQWRSGVGVYDYLSHKATSTTTHFLSGHAITAAYMTVIGPIEFSLMHGDQAGSFRTYVNIGFNF